MSTLSALLRIRQGGAGSEIVSQPGQLATYGKGIVKLYFATETITIPAGVTSMRGRVIGAGTGTGATTSIGSIMSATGSNSSAGGAGVGGDFQASGGAGGAGVASSSGGGGGAAGSELGTGGAGTSAGTGTGGNGGSVGAASLGETNLLVTRLYGNDFNAVGLPPMVLANGLIPPFPFHSFTGRRGVHGDTTTFHGGNGGPGAGGGGSYSQPSIAGTGGFGGGGGGASAASGSVSGSGGIGGGSGGGAGSAGVGGGGYARGVFNTTPGASLVLTVPSGALIILEY